MLKLSCNWIREYKSKENECFKEKCKFWGMFLTFKLFGYNCKLKEFELFFYKVISDCILISFLHCAKHFVWLMIYGKIVFVNKFRQSIIKAKMNIDLETSIYYVFCLLSTMIGEQTIYTHYILLKIRKIYYI